MSSENLTIRASDGRLVTLPTVDMLWVLKLSEATDSMVFWHWRDDSATWQPVLMPRSVYEHEADLGWE